MTYITFEQKFEEPLRGSVIVFSLCHESSIPQIETASFSLGPGIQKGLEAEPQTTPSCFSLCLTWQKKIYAIFFSRLLKFGTLLCPSCTIAFQK